jgi:hypothetical protein
VHALPSTPAAKAPSETTAKVDPSHVPAAYVEWPLEFLLPGGYEHSMGFVGRFAASPTSARLTASAFILTLGALPGCSIEQPVSGPVSLTGEWKTIEPSEPLRVGGKEQQVFCLQVVGTMSDVDFEKGRLLVDGQWHVLGGEAVDNEQTKYTLKVGLLLGPTFPGIGQSSGSACVATRRFRLGKSGGIPTIKSKAGARSHR